jgi:polyisoprenyl-phosphate glycosyltransferase
MIKAVIVTPVYDDWNNLSILIENIHSRFQSSDWIKIVEVVAVNDGSPKEGTENFSSKSHSLPITLLHLTINMGHQRAIAIGLAYIFDQPYEFDCVVVMDSDGEDDPCYIDPLLKKTEREEYQKIVFAARTKRFESLRFRLLYLAYKFVFRILTNASISFGNFSCVPKKVLGRLLSSPDLWNHFPGSILKSKLPFETIPAIRHKRYSGSSKMNLQGLLVHGLSSISIYLEVVTVKLFLISIFGIMIIILLLVIVALLRIFTTFAIPGWASSTSIGLVNTGGLLFLTTLLLLLMQLNQRNSIRPSIRDFYQALIFSREKLPKSQGRKT